MLSVLSFTYPTFVKFTCSIDRLSRFDCSQLVVPGPVLLTFLCCPVLSGKSPRAAKDIHHHACSLHQGTTVVTDEDVVGQSWQHLHLFVGYVSSHTHIYYLHEQDLYNILGRPRLSLRTGRYISDQFRIFRACRADNKPRKVAYAY
jgi:hypothetical protein